MAEPTALDRPRPAAPADRAAEAVYGAPRESQPRGTVAAPVLDMAVVDALLPAAGRDILAPLVLAMLRPDARRWLGAEQLSRLAGALRLKEAALAQMLDAVPRPPATLGESGGPWLGRRVPLLGRDGRLGWAELFWRPDPAAPRPAGAGPRPAGGAFVLRLALSATGLLEIRGRLEGGRLDAVLEAEQKLRKRTAADLVESFEAAIGLLRMSGRLTVLSGRESRRT